jgi:hypothetical protein
MIKNDDGSIGYSNSGMLPSEDILRTINEHHATSRNEEVEESKRYSEKYMNINHAIANGDTEALKLVSEELATLKQQREWREISTCPKDGTLFLASDGKSVFITRPAKDNLLRNTCKYINPHANLMPSKKPKYWTDLPSPPTEKDKP